MAHLIEEVFGQCSPRPVHFFYRRTAGITSPDVCVRSLFHSLLEIHDLTEAEESKRQDSLELVYHKLVRLLTTDIAPRLAPGRPQLIFVDALDEADDVGAAFRRIPEALPAGVYVIASTRLARARAALARRPHLEWFNLDDPDLTQEILLDGREYVQRELVDAGLAQATLDELARVGAGNFLVLKLLCRHAHTAPAPQQVGALLSRSWSMPGRGTCSLSGRMTRRMPRDSATLIPERRLTRTRRFALSRPITEFWLASPPTQAGSRRRPTGAIASWYGTLSASRISASLC